MLSQVAAMCSGFSGREVAKLFISLQCAIYGGAADTGADTWSASNKAKKWTTSTTKSSKGDGEYSQAGFELTESFIIKVVSWKVREHEQKEGMAKEAVTWA